MGVEHHAELESIPTAIGAVGVTATVTDPRRSCFVSSDWARAPPTAIEQTIDVTNAICTSEGIVGS
jgi:hypothetical protein